jgi:hypothetical protein
MQYHRHWTSLALTLALALVPLRATQADTAPAATTTQPITEPLATYAREWRDTPAAAGQKEVAIYDATNAEGKAHFPVTLSINREMADPVTKTRAVDPSAKGMREAYRLLLRADIPTGGPPRAITAMCYVGLADLKSLKLDVGVQDAAGVTFKEYVNHKGTLIWSQFSCQAGEGRKEGTYSPPPGFAFVEVLPLTLRALPFDKPGEMEL